MSDTPPDWSEWWLEVPLPDGLVEDDRRTGEHLEALMRLCLEVCPGGVTQEDHRAPPGSDPLPERGTVRLRVYTPLDELEEARGRLSAGLSRYPGARLEHRPLDPDWRERWKRWFHTVAISPELRVCPPWELEQARVRQGWTVVIEPGMAFGTGQHETTILCLERLVQLHRDSALPNAVLDVGCGTGILGIAARLMGARDIVGLDCDPAAIVNALENVERNQMKPSALRLSTTPVEELSGEFPLVVANILAHILMDLAPALVARTEVGGMLILSGILEEQVAALEARFAALGATCESRQVRGPWVRCDLRRQS